MKGKSIRWVGPVFMVGDVVSLILAFVSAWVLRVWVDPRPLLNQITGEEYFASLLVIIPFFILTFACIGLYKKRILRKWGKVVLLTFLGCFVGTLLVIAYEYVAGRPVFPARLMMIYVLCISAFFVLIVRGVVELVFRMIRKRGGKIRVLLIGNSEMVGELAASIVRDPGSEYELVAYAGPKKYMREAAKCKHFDEPEEALAQLKRLRIESIIQTNFYEEKARNREILHRAEELHIEYRFMPGEPEFYLGKNEVDVALGYPMVLVSQTPLVGWSLVIKRTFDLLLIIILAPIWGSLFLLLMVGQKVFNPGKMFFRQTRLGRYGKEFRIWKFRSMREKYSGQDAITIFRDMGRDDLAREYAANRKIMEDPRIAGWWGKFLRRMSLDEFAQILNVVRGEMSLVGPRPILPDELDFYKSQSPLLLSVKPGLTGFASVSGRSELEFSERTQLELFYAQNWTFWLDLKIMVLTVGVVISGKGAR